MLNLNHYTAAAGFPDGSEYKTYMAELEKSVGRVGGKVLWRTPVSGQPVGCEHDEVDESCRLVPKLRLVLGLRTEPGSAEMYQLQEL